MKLNSSNTSLYFLFFFIALAVCLDVFFIVLIFIKDARRDGRAANFSLIFVETHGKTSNRPTVDDISAALTDENAPSGRQLRVYTRTDNGLQTVPDLNLHVDQMTYSLLFPYGEPGNSLNYRPLCLISKSDKPGELEMMFSDENNRPTIRQFYSARIAIRRNFSLLYSSARLCQTYVVDQVVKIQNYRLTYHRNYQIALRVESYHVLENYLTNVAIKHPQQTGQKRVPIGKKFILPSSFTHSPRNLQQKYQDAIAMVRDVEKPDLFITSILNGRRLLTTFLSIKRSRIVLI